MYKQFIVNEYLIQRQIGGVVVKHEPASPVAEHVVASDRIPHFHTPVSDARARAYSEL